MSPRKRPAPEATDEVSKNPSTVSRPPNKKLKKDWKRYNTDSQSVHPSVAISEAERLKETQIKNQFKRKTHLQEECQRRGLATDGVRQTMLNRIILSERTENPVQTRTSISNLGEGTNANAATGTGASIARCTSNNHSRESSRQASENSKSTSPKSQKTFTDLFIHFMTELTYEQMQEECTLTRLSPNGGKAELAGRLLDEEFRLQTESQQGDDLHVDLSSTWLGLDFLDSPDSTKPFITDAEEARLGPLVQDIYNVLLYPGEVFKMPFDEFIYRKSDDLRNAVPVAMISNGKKEYVTHTQLRKIKPAATWWTAHDITTCHECKLLPQPRPQNMKALPGGGVAYFSIAGISESSESSGSWTSSSEEEL